MIHEILTQHLNDQGVPVEIVDNGLGLEAVGRHKKAYCGIVVLGDIITITRVGKIDCISLTDPDSLDQLTKNVRQPVVIETIRTVLREQGYNCNLNGEVLTVHIRKGEKNTYPIYLAIFGAELRITIANANPIGIDLNDPDSLDTLLDKLPRP